MSGAKVVATNSALTHYNFVAPVALPIQKPEFSVIFMAPMSAPGVKLLARASYELVAATTGSPFDYPLSSRLDENDAILIFDRALIPWENVFVYGDAEKAWRGFATHSGFRPRLSLQASRGSPSSSTSSPGSRFGPRSSPGRVSSVACRSRSARSWPRVTSSGD